MADLTRAQQKEVKRLTEEKGLTEEQARRIATQEQLDYPMGLDGEPLVEPPGPTPVPVMPPSGPPRATEDTPPLVVRKPD